MSIKYTLSLTNFQQFHFILSKNNFRYCDISYPIMNYIIQQFQPTCYLLELIGLMNLRHLLPEYSFLQYPFPGRV